MYARRVSLLGSVVGSRPFGEAKVTSWPASRSFWRGFASSWRKKPEGCSTVLPLLGPLVFLMGNESASLRMMRIFLDFILDMLMTIGK